MGLTPEEIDIVHRGALMHDIGKIIIPDAILLKKGPLTPEEWIIVKQHPQTGYDIVRACPAMEKVSEIVFSHQERYDGSGYPRGLKGNLICLGARIFAIIDTYDAIRSNRPYSSGKSAEVAIAQIKAGRGTQFDPEVVDAFYRCQPRIEACL
jgi:HD-GYP domain-containing protein (c-di-GMP phosphodiesterase class II)